MSQRGAAELAAGLRSWPQALGAAVGVRLEAHHPPLLARAPADLARLQGARLVMPAGNISLPAPNTHHYDFDESAWEGARIDKVMINVA